MTDVMTEGGTLYANAANRTVRGLLLPYGEVSRPSNVGPISFDRGTVRLPRDPAIVTGNLRHNREEPVARATSLEDTDAGIVAEFAIADTEEGDALLADIANGKLSRLSAEVKGIVRNGTKALSGALFGAAFVDEGAFASASLYAELATTEEHFESEYTDENGVVWRRVEDTTTDRDTETNKTTVQTTVVTETETPETAEDEESEMANATVPETLNASTNDVKPLGKTALFEAITASKTKGDNTGLNEFNDMANALGLFALNDIKISGTSQVGTGIVQPAYVGELWSGKRVVRKVIPLISSGPLTSLEVKGWRWNTKPEVSTWAGNKADVPTNTPTTTSYTVGIQRFAGGHDIAREFVDFNVTEVLDSYAQAMVDSYALKSDSYALTQLLTAAGAATAAEVYPTIGGRAVSDAVGKIIQGALEVITAGAVPSFALVAPDVYKLLAYTPKEMVSEFLAQSLNLSEAEAQVGFKVIPHTGLAAGQVLVGAKEAATALELPGSPIRVNALDIARGGYDEAIFGYIGVKVDYPDGLALIGNRA